LFPVAALPTEMSPPLLALGTVALVVAMEDAEPDDGTTDETGAAGG
jgi:hypothetical protein